jgi:hypothetical protein
MIGGGGRYFAATSTTRGTAGRGRTSRCAGSSSINPRKTANSARTAGAARSKNEANPDQNAS